MSRVGNLASQDFYHAWSDKNPGLQGCRLPELDTMQMHRKQVQFVEIFNEIVSNILPIPRKAAILKRQIRFYRKLINILFCGYWRKLEIHYCWSTIADPLKMHTETYTHQGTECPSE
jgi:hypothetical protein